MLAAQFSKKRNNNKLKGSDERIISASQESHHLAVNEGELPTSNTSSPFLFHFSLNDDNNNDNNNNNNNGKSFKKRQRRKNRKEKWKNQTEAASEEQVVETYAVATETDCARTTTGEEEQTKPVVPLCCHPESFVQANSKLEPGTTISAANAITPHPSDLTTPQPDDITTIAEQPEPFSFDFDPNSMRDDDDDDKSTQNKPTNSKSRKRRERKKRQQQQQAKTRRKRSEINPDGSSMAVPTNDGTNRTGGDDNLASMATSDETFKMSSPSTPRNEMTFCRPTPKQLHEETKQTNNNDVPKNAMSPTGDDSRASELLRENPVPPTPTIRQTNTKETTVRPSRPMKTRPNGPRSTKPKKQSRKLPSHPQRQLSSCQTTPPKSNRQRPKLGFDSDKSKQTKALVNQRSMMLYQQKKKLARTIIVGDGRTAHDMEGGCQNAFSFGFDVCLSES